MDALKKCAARLLSLSSFWTMQKPPFVHAVGGSWLCPKKEIAAGNFDAITALCREASAIVREVRE